MKKPSAVSPQTRTHFEQVPIEIVKKIIDQDPPKPRPDEPPSTLRIVRREI